jgi:hypothetical protein
MQRGVPTRYGAASELAGAPPPADADADAAEGRGALTRWWPARRGRRPAPRGARARRWRRTAPRTSPASAHACATPPPHARGARGTGGADGMQGEEIKKKQRGGVARVGVAPKKRGQGGTGVATKHLFSAQLGQRSRAVLGALSAGAKMGWTCPNKRLSRALMSPPFLWNSCNMPQHHRDATRRRAVRAASRAGNQRIQASDHVACLDEGDVILLGRRVDCWAVNGDHAV